MSSIGPVGGGYAALVQQATAKRAGSAVQTQTRVRAGQAQVGLPSGPKAVGAPVAPAARGVEAVLSSVRDAQATADRMVVDLASGRDLNIHNTMVELEKADIALKYTVQLRNRALSAYEELMRMQI